jgi:hypothetical protein
MLRSPKHHYLLVSLVVSIVTSHPCAAQDKPDIRHQIADAYGLGSWSQVDQIRYTFNFDAGAKKAARSWTWDVKGNQVTYEGPDSAGKPVKTTYSRASMAPDVVKDVDPNFINDQYWLIFVFHMVWDKDVTVEDKGMTTAPLGKGKARKVTVTYPKTGGGYTPGDMYDLFVGADNRVVAWNFHRGGAPEPLLTMSWDDYKMAGPILIALDHRGPLGGKPGHIFLSGVAVKLVGASDFVAAK